MKKLALFIGIIFCSNLFSASSWNEYSDSISKKARIHAGSEPAAITDLPTELIEKILFFLPAKDQEALRSTNRLFRHVPTIDVVFHMGSIQSNETPYAAEFLRARVDVRILAIRSIKTNILLNALAQYSFSQLVDLDLGWNSMTSPLLKKIRDLAPNLKSLRVTCCHLTRKHADIISQMINLTSLDIGFNQIGDAGAASISRLTNLTTLNIEANDIIAAGAASISQMPNLIDLNIGRNFIRAAGAASIRQLSNLTTLDIGYNQLGNAGASFISQLTNLTTLNIELNQIGDAGAGSISRMRSLTTLYIAHNQIGEAGKDLLRQALPNTDIRFS